MTETWLAQGSRMEMEAENLLLGHGLAVHYLNRLPSVNGVSHGGVAVILRDTLASAVPFPFPNPDSFEVLPLIVTLPSIARKLYVIAAYIPPSYSVPRGKACLQHINNLVLEIKRKSNEPYIVVAGDFNQWNIAESLEDYPDISEVPSPPTREDRKIDLIFTNWCEDIHDSGCLPPLETEGENRTKTYSDHSIQYMLSRVLKKPQVKWESFSYRPYNERAAEGFIRELSLVDWSVVYNEIGSNNMAVKFQQVLDDLTHTHFPLRTVRRKEDDLPWYDSVARKMSKKKLAIYRSEGKSERWEAQCSKLESRLEGRQQVYLQRQRDKMMGPEASKNFFKNVRAYKSADRPKDFDIRTLRPGCSDAQIATEAAKFFNKISDEFSPLEPSDIPATYHRDLPLLSPANVQQMLLKAKKPSSMVPGDIFPALINRCSGLLAWPLSAIYNNIILSYRWPTHWKREYVTLIPKKSKPAGFPDLRNISCTNFFSKVFEKYVQTCLKEEIQMKSNQYGGVKGCSTTHMIIDILQEVCENAEDYRSATVLCAIDYAKAFNRMSFQHCLDAFRKKNASTPVLRLIATFLTNRTMTVRVGQSWSEPLPVNGGCPQGSVLGVDLFNGTTDFLEDDFVEFENRRLHLPSITDVTVINTNNTSGSYEPVRTSSPEKENPVPFVPPVSPVLEPPGPLEAYCPNVKNKPLPQPVLHIPPEEPATGTQVLTRKAVKFFKYVDDNISVEKLNFGNVPVVTRDTEKVKIKQALGTQNAFRSVTRKAEEKDMVVNTGKTNLLTISDALNHRPEAYILDSEGKIINSGKTIKILGFTLSDRPTVAAHVDTVSKSIRQRNWSLAHLGKIGFNADELVKVYKSTIRPIADYCCPAYHPMMNDIQDQKLEQAQVAALRRIFGYKLSATTLRDRAQVETLRERRIDLTDKFANKCLASERFRRWFPENVGRKSSRIGERYVESFAKCDRLKNSPLFYMRRRLNGKQGKTYGERNRKYRENLRLD